MPQQPKIAPPVPMMTPRKGRGPLPSYEEELARITEQQKADLAAVPNITPTASYNPSDYQIGERPRLRDSDGGLQPLTRNLQQEGGRSIAPSLWAALAGGLLGGGQGALAGFSGAQQGFRQGADLADAERVRQYAQAQELQQRNYADDMAGYQDALDTRNLNLQLAQANNQLIQQDNSNALARAGLVDAITGRGQGRVDQALTRAQQDAQFGESSGIQAAGMIPDILRAAGTQPHRQAGIIGAANTAAGLNLPVPDGTWTYGMNPQDVPAANQPAQFAARQKFEEWKALLDSGDAKAARELEAQLRREGYANQKTIAGMQIAGDMVRAKAQALMKQYEALGTTDDANKAMIGFRNGRTESYNRIREIKKRLGELKESFDPDSKNEKMGLMTELRDHEDNIRGYEQRMGAIKNQPYRDAQYGVEEKNGILVPVQPQNTAPSPPSGAKAPGGVKPGAYNVVAPGGRKVKVESR